MLPIGRYELSGVCYSKKDLCKGLQASYLKIVESSAVNGSVEVIVKRFSLLGSDIVFQTCSTNVVSLWVSKIA